MCCRIFACIFSLIFLVTVNPAMAAKPEVEFKFALVNNLDNLYGFSTLLFAKRVEELSAGKMKVHVFHSGQLGSGEREMIEGLQLGSVDICTVSSSPVTSYQKEFLIFNFPYLFKNLDTYYKVVDGHIGGELGKLMEKHDIKVIGWWNLGLFGFTNSKKPVHSAADAKGLKIRTQENPMIIAFWKYLNAVPTPMAFGELFTALQQGTVDGQETAVADWAANRYFETQKYGTVTGHYIMAAPVLASKAKYDSLTDGQKKIFDQAMREAVLGQRKEYDRLLKLSIDTIRKNGMEIDTEPDNASFAEATKGMYADFTKQLPPVVGKWVSEIQAMHKK